jgi:hypothetical protein
MERVKKLDGDRAPWVVGKRQVHELFLLDVVQEIKGVGPTAAGKLRAAGLNTVAQLVANGSSHQIAGITSKSLAKFVANCSGAVQGAFPVSRVVDYKLEANPYLALHGDQWEIEITKTTAMQKYACISELVTHMIHASAAIFKGTTHEWTWMMLHDALSLMTSIECRAWMETQILHGPTEAQNRTFLDCWILPEQGLNAGTVYAKRPPGNCPGVTLHFVTLR